MVLEPYSPFILYDKYPIFSLINIKYVLFLYYCMFGSHSYTLRLLNDNEIIQCIVKIIMAYGTRVKLK